MPARALSRATLHTVATIAAALTVAAAVGEPHQQPSQPPAPPATADANGRVAIRGCLAGSKLTHLEPQGTIAVQLPETLFVTSIRVIRDQVKALDKHQVEVIGTLRGIPGQETGILVAGSDKGRVYIGGGDPRLGQDLAPGTQPAPGIQAYTIKDIGSTCSAGQAK